MLEKQPDGLPVVPVGATTEDPDMEVDFSHVPFNDESDADEEGGPAGAAAGGPRDDSLLQLSATDTTAGGIDTMGVSGLDESIDTTTTTTGQNKRITPPPKRKRKKRRKVVIDNNSTELSNEDIKSMLADTSDIVGRQEHPAEDHDELQDTPTNNNNNKDQPVVLTRPFLADDGHLNQQLVQLWNDNFYRANDGPCPFEKRPDAEDVEENRQEQPQEDEDASRSDLDATEFPPANNLDEEEEEPLDFPAPMMDEDDGPGPALDEDDEEEDQAHERQGT
jgi:hypothetical protein